MNFRGKEMPAKPEDFEFAKRQWGFTEKLLAGGEAGMKLKMMPTVKEGGLEGVFEGLEALRQGKVSAQKLVYRI